MSQPSEPSFAERARDLVARARMGALSTVSRRRPGHPFGSVAPYSSDGRGRPVFLISGLALHTKNLEADPRASLLVAEPDAVEETLAAPRVTLMGEARRLAPAELTAERARYLERHPTAAAWVDFADFSFWRLEVTEVYFVGGFGAMDWIAGEAYVDAAAR